MRLSIVIVNWNSKDYLAQALASLAASGDAAAHEIVVIDSGSFDGCAELLRGLRPRPTFVQAATNLGFARANNEAVRHAHGDVLLFLNPDTEVAEGAVAALLQALDALPQAGIVGPRLLNSDGSVQETCVRAFPTLLNQALDSDLLRRRFPRSRLWGKRALGEAGASPRQVEAVSGACLMIRRPLFEAVGGFSEDYFMYGEDMDLCLKVRRAGFASYHVPGATVVHHGGGSSDQAGVSTFAAVMRLESQWRFFRKTRSSGYAASYRAVMCAASLARLAALAAAWPLQRLRSRGPATRHALRKWAARLRWTLGGERWARDA